LKNGAWFKGKTTTTCNTKQEVFRERATMAKAPEISSKKEPI